MKYPNYIRSSVRISLRQIPIIDETPDETEAVNNRIRELKEKEEQSIPHKMLIRFLTELNKYTGADVSGYNESNVIFNKLIGDKKLSRKIKRMYNDHSYTCVGNTIDVWVDDGVGKVDIVIRKYPNLDITDIMSKDPKKLINWIYNHFDTMFICTDFPVNMNSESAMIEDIAEAIRISKKEVPAPERIDLSGLWDFDFSSIDCDG